MGVPEEQAPLFKGHVHDVDQDTTNVEEALWFRHWSLRRCLVYGLMVQAMLLILFTTVAFAIIRRAIDTDSDPDTRGR